MKKQNKTNLKKYYPLAIVIGFLLPNDTFVARNN